MLWDVFISHASEDKADVARPLAAVLESAGLRVWIDEAQLRMGDSLSQKLDEGLSQSRFGVVILSHSFFSKPWPKRELGAFLARSNAILPVWHNISAEELAGISPLLTDLLAASTADGIELVAEKILQVAGTHLRRRHRTQAIYTSQLSVRQDRIRRALEVLESLANPATWAQLDTASEDYPETGWMGTESSVLVEILYGFWAPLVEYDSLEYSIRRNLALLDTRSRLQFALLEAAFGCVLNESQVAAIDPAIEYTPRVPGWRQKRLKNPVRYWWQGISPDRFEAGAPFFLRSDTVQPGTGDPLLTVHEFLHVYRSAFASNDDNVKQAIGLLANGFYGFRPTTRPVLWRVCVCMARIYQALLGNSQFDPEAGNLMSLDKLYHPEETNCFPYQLPVASVELYEPHSQTLAATLQYLEATTLARIRAYLSAPREDPAET